MSDTGDMWREVKKDSKKKKSRNLEYAIKELDERGIEYKTNNGIHFMITLRSVSSLDILETIDYWPSTGLFRVKAGVHGRGVKNLLKCIGKISEDSGGATTRLFGKG